MKIFQVKLLIRLIVTLVFISFSSLAGNIKLADSYFLKEQYQLAKEEYLAVAETASPRAYYQLGAIYYQGLGIKADDFKALIWFSMAAEQNYNNSVEIVDNLLTSVATKDKAQVMQILESFQASFGKEKLYRKYYPELIEKNLATSIRFDDKSDLSHVNIITDFDFNDSTSVVDNNVFYSNADSDFGEYTNSGLQQSATPFDNDYFLIADYDIAPDGSIRDVTVVKGSGNVKLGIYELSLNTMPKPNYKEKGIHFVNRSYLGIASYDKYRMRRNHRYIYSRIKRLANKQRQSDLPQDKFKYAMSLIDFPWLKQIEGEVDILLKSAAEQGYALAKYEYGLKLYREQKNIKQAIYWLCQATEQGLSQAQYRLARILLDSPWVINDEKKALFWLEQAADQGHLSAKLKSAEIKLLTKDMQLQDIEGAIAYLTGIGEQQNENPQYQYLQAIAHAKKENRELSEAVNYLRIAIDLGKDVSWDISPWEVQLKKWTTGGRVTIQEL